MTEVPFLDLKAQYAAIRPDIDIAIARVLDSTAFVLGPAVNEFEQSFADYTERKHCIALNSGTSALHLALLTAGVGPGDEVVTTPHTWISTSWAISYCGARPVFADIDADTGNLDPEAAERVIGPHTKALLPVDLYGNPADLNGLEALADAHGLALIEDAAQSHGARLTGRPAGAFGAVGCFSFYPGKNLGAAGEGGAVVTDNPDVAARIRQLRDHAQDGRHHHVEIGFNHRMDGLQAAILEVKLGHLDRWNDDRRAAAERYRKLLGDIPQIDLPHTTPGADPCWHLYVVRSPRRDALARCLGERGIQTGLHYPTPVHLQPAYAHLGYKRGDFPVAERFASRCLSLPIFAEITTDQQEHVANALHEAAA